MPITLVASKDSYLVWQKLNQIKKNFAPELNAFNYKYYSTTNLDDFLDVCQIIFFGLNKRLIIFNDCQWFTKGKDKLSPKELEKLKQVVSDVANSVEIYLACYSELDSSLKSTKLFKEFCSVLDLPQATYYSDSNNAKMVDLVKQIAKSQKCSLDDKAINMLLSYSNGNLWQIHQEICKLSTYIIPNQNIDSKIVSKSCDSQGDAFVLLGDFLDSSGTNFFSNFEALLSKTSIIQLIALFNTMFAKWIKIKILANYFNSKLPVRPGIIKREMPLKDLSIKIAKEINSSPFIIEKDLKRIEKISLEYLKKCQQNLIILESQIKSGQINDRLGFELFLMENGNFR